MVITNEVVTLCKQRAKWRAIRAGDESLADDLTQEALVKLHKLEEGSPVYEVEATIQRAMIDYLRQDSWIPRRQHKELSNITRFVEAFRVQNGRHPTVSELIAALGADSVGTLAEFHAAVNSLAQDEEAQGVYMERLKHRIDEAVRVLSHAKYQRHLKELELLLTGVSVNEIAVLHKVTSVSIRNRLNVIKDILTMERDRANNQ